MSLQKLAGLRILIAEDEVLILMEIEDMLLEMDCTIVGPAATVEETLKAIRDKEIDGALRDMGLHGKRITPAADALVARGVQASRIGVTWLPEPTDGSITRQGAGYQLLATLVIAK